MQPKPHVRIALVLAVVLATWVSIARAAPTDTYVGRLIAEDLFDKLKFSGRIAVWPVDDAQARASGIAPPAAAALAENIRVAIHHLGAARGLTFVEREAISKIFQEQQFAHGAKDSDFAALAHRANADALVLIGLHREDPGQIVVSARLVRAKGTAVGQIIATSKAYELAMAETAPSPPAAAAAPTSPSPAASQLPFGRPLPPTWPGTVTPTSAGVSVYGASYALAYVVAPAAAYAYPAPAYYVGPRFAGPQLSFAYFGGYGRGGRRR